MKKTWRYNPFTDVYHKSRSYDVWFLRYKVQRTKFFCYFGPFLPFDPPNNPKNQNFEIKKIPGDIIILHLRTTNDDQMMHGSWDIKCDRQFFFILDFFLPFYPLTAQKIKKWKKWKKHLGITSFYKSVSKIIIICHNVLEIWHVTDVIAVFHFGQFLAFYSPNNPKNQNFKTMKNTSRYHFTQLYQKL